MNEVIAIYPITPSSPMGEWSDEWAAKGMSDSQMESAEKFTRMFYKPGLMAVMGVIFSPLVGLVLSLILSAFLKRKPVVIAEGTPPVA